MSRLRVAVLATLALLCALAPTAAQAALGEPVVMTRNLYLGSSLTNLAAAPPAQVPVEAAIAFGKVQANNFPLRAEALADEINATKPDAIGLQEVSRYFTGPFLDPAPATTLVLDYMTELQGELAARGLNYTVVHEAVEANLEAPAFLGGSNPANWRDVRLQIGNAILVRNGVPFTNVQSGNFVSQISFQGVPLTRNWESVDLKVGPKDFKFLNTHLEADNNTVSTAQARELIAGPLRSTKPVIAVGDYNSGPGGPPGAYALLTAANQGKMRDAAATSGNTCCFPELLFNTGSLSQRIDLILTNPASVKTLGVTRTGVTQVNGLYPSDHAGVVATLRVP